MSKFVLRYTDPDVEQTVDIHDKEVTETTEEEFALLKAGEQDPDARWEVALTKDTKRATITDASGNSTGDSVDTIDSVSLTEERAMEFCDCDIEQLQELVAAAFTIAEEETTDKRELKTVPDEVVEEVILNGATTDELFEQLAVATEAKKEHFSKYQAARLDIRSLLDRIDEAIINKRNANESHPEPVAAGDLEDELFGNDSE